MQYQTFRPLPSSVGAHPRLSIAHGLPIALARRSENIHLLRQLPKKRQRVSVLRLCRAVQANRNGIEILNLL